MYNTHTADSCIDSKLHINARLIKKFIRLPNPNVSNIIPTMIPIGFNASRMLFVFKRLEKNY